MELGKRRLIPKYKKCIDVFDMDDKYEFSLSRWLTDEKYIKIYKAEDDPKFPYRVSVIVAESTNNAYKLILHCKTKRDAEFWVYELGPY